MIQQTRVGLDLVIILNRILKLNFQFLIWIKVSDFWTLSRITLSSKYEVGSVEDKVPFDFWLGLGLGLWQLNCCNFPLWRIHRSKSKQRRQSFSSLSVLNAQFHHWKACIWNPRTFLLQSFDVFCLEVLTSSVWLRNYDQSLINDDHTTINKTSKWK